MSIKELQQKIDAQQELINTLKTNFRKLLKRAECNRCSASYLVYESDFQCIRHDYCDSCHEIFFGEAYGEPEIVDEDTGDWAMVITSSDPSCEWVNHSDWKYDAMLFNY